MTSHDGASGAHETGDDVLPFTPPRGRSGSPRVVDEPIVVVAPAVADQIVATDRLKQDLQDLADLARVSLRRNAMVNLVVRALMGAAGLSAMALAIRYTWVHGDAMVTTLTTSKSDARIAGEVLALSLPVVLLVALATLLASAAWLLYSRGHEEFASGLESIARLHREAEVALSARGLTHVFEEKLATIRKAFSLQLWLGRALFIVSLALLAAALISTAVSGVDVTTVAFGGGSLISALYGTTQKVPQNVACRSADVLQMQCIVTGYLRQLSLLEAHAYGLVSQQLADPQPRDETIRQLSLMIDEATDRAVARIESFADPGARSTPAGQVSPPPPALAAGPPE